ncbi:hypothetical protein [Intrasporangium flavum]|uniref:hypothetical protein n=1 Tax=Intrasporangium flavum TaxID=1428657 RepID=UPI00096BE47C|nr:hypothetical protein [Intrasporangium flavum]
MSAPRTNIPVAVPAGAPANRPGGTGPAGGGTRTIAGSLPGARGVADRLLHGTPGRMRLYGLVGVIAALLLGAISANALLASQAAVERAANNTAQVVRAQSIHVDLLRADALATNAFLVGGVESADSRARYEEAMGAVAKALSEAAAAQPADGTALGALSQQVQTYVGLVEQARANNRLNLPIGATYLTQASDGLRSDAIPIVEAVVSANEQRASAEFDRSNSSLQLLVGLVSLIALVLIAVWLAKRTHRYLNPSLSAAIVILVVGLFVAASTIGGIGNATRNVQQGDFKTAVQLAGVTTAANDARANESLTLIKRGSGASYEKKWKTDDTAVRTALGDDSTLLADWNAYRGVHTKVRSLDDNGQWDQAVALSTSIAADGAATAFTAFDNAAAAQRDKASQSAVANLEGLGGSAPYYAAALAIAALVAAWLVVRGFGQRIEEYR